jgi:hypothetical protein
MISKQSDAFFVLALPLNPNAIPPLPHPPSPLPSPNKKKTLESSIVILFPTELLPQFPKVDEIESKQEEKTLPLHVSLLAFKNSTKSYFDIRKKFFRYSKKCQ